MVIKCGSVHTQHIGHTFENRKHVVVSDIPKQSDTFRNRDMEILNLAQVRKFLTQKPTQGHSLIKDSLASSPFTCVTLKVLSAKE